MKNLNRFLNPVRKPNKKFVLSSAFVEEDGTPIEWELRALSAKECKEISDAAEDRQGSDILAMQVAASLVYPNLKDAELVNAEKEKHGGKILSPDEILIDLLDGAEYSKLVGIFNEHNSVTMDFPKLVEEAKN